MVEIKEREREREEHKELFCIQMLYQMRKELLKNHHGGEVYIEIVFFINSVSLNIGLCLYINRSDRRLFQWNVCLQSFF